MPQIIDFWTSSSRTFKIITIVCGALASASGAIAGVPVAWRTLGLPEVVSRQYVDAQYKSLDEKTAAIYNFQRSDRIERLEENSDQAELKIKEYTAKLPEVHDPAGVAAIQDLISDQTRKKRHIDEKIMELKNEH